MVVRDIGAERGERQGAGKERKVLGGGRRDNMLVARIRVRSTIEHVQVFGNR